MTKLILGLLLATATILAQAAETQAPLRFGVLNQQSPVRTAQRWNPILKYLSDATGLKFQLRMGATVEETNTLMGAGEFDLAFTNHNFRKEYDGVYRVIARWAGAPIHGVVAVNADSPAHSLRELAGKRVAFPSRDAFVAYAVPMAEFKNAKVSVTPVFAANQEGALAQLKARQVDAAAVNSRFLASYAAQQGLKYREVFVSEAYADLPVLAHPRLPKSQVDAIQKALLGMKNDPRARQALEAGAFTGFEPAGDSDYDNVRRVYRSLAD